MCGLYEAIDLWPTDRTGSSQNHCGCADEGRVIEAFLRALAVHVAYLAEALGIFAVAAGLVRAVWRYVRGSTSNAPEMNRIQIRLELGQSLVLALEFLLAADILRTAVAPSWDALGRLGAIVVIRTVLNFFLQREMEHERKQLREEVPGAG